jgi:hypothetical protein
MKDEALKLAAEFDKRFTSMNGVDVPERVSVPRDEWRALNAAIKQALAAPVQPVAWVTGFHAGRCVIKTINPAAILPVGVALYTTPPAVQPEQDEDLYDLAVKTDNWGQP